MSCEKIGLLCCGQGQGHLTADPFATTVGLIVHHHKVDCLVKRLDCFVMVKVKVTEKVQNFSECSSE